MTMFFVQLKSASSDPSLSHDLRSINERAANLSRSISDIKKKMLGIGNSAQNQSQFNFGSAIVDFDNYDDNIMQNNIQLANEGVDHIYKANDLANVLQAKGRDTKAEVIEQGDIVDMIDKDLNDMHIDQQIAETKTMKIRCFSAIDQRGKDIIIVLLFVVMFLEILLKIF